MTLQGRGVSELGVDPTALIEKIASRTAIVDVVGLGYVGLTVACALARAGFRVTGIDVDSRKVGAVNQGEYPQRGAEPGLPELLAEQTEQGRLVATDDCQVCVDADIILVAVDTPVDEITKAPALTNLRSAARAIGAHLRPQTLVIIESTVPPGTMRDIVVPALEEESGLSAQRDFFAGCCPERVMPGKLLANLASCSRVMGGWTPDAGAIGAALYRTVTSGEVDATDCLTAELVKTAENAYRDVQIAFANEIALLCEGYGAEVYLVRDLVNKSPFRDMHLPGAGVGGHCIPKDPWLLVAGAGAAGVARLIPAARAVNDAMPIHVAGLLKKALEEHGRALDDSRILVLGYAYLENSDDGRNSPTAHLTGWLGERGASVAVHDPLVPGFELDFGKAAPGSDAIVLMVAHDQYRCLDLVELARHMRTRVLIDGRHLYGAAEAHAAGFDYRCLGVGGGAGVWG